MTAEIAIVNRGAVALAADSAVTVGGRDRVWKRANKLFSLGPAHDIAMMVFGNAEYLGIPWEVIIKEFRQSASQNNFERLADCRTSFQTFLLSERLRRTTEQQRRSIHYLLYFIIDKLPKYSKGTKKLSHRKVLVKSIAENLNEVEEDDIIIDIISPKEFLRVFIDDIRTISENIIETKLPLSVTNQIGNLCFETFRRRHASDVDSGIVFAGFGRDELFPAVLSITVDGCYGVWLRSWENTEIDHDLNAQNNGKEVGGAIVPFGQSDIAYLYMEGIGPRQLAFIEEAIFRLLELKSKELIQQYVPSANRTVETAIQKKDNAAATEHLMDSFADFRREIYVNNVMRVVSSLPKEEMADMAEALVEVTALRRKVDSRLESVSEPVDVAVITKGDGVVWVKRKHYFDPALNADFGERKRLRGGRHENANVDEQQAERP